MPPEREMAAARESKPWEMFAITSRLSVGITLYPLDDGDVEGLLRHADSAMYQAKQSGRGCYRLFTTQIDPDRRRQHELERDIHAAVALNQFELAMAPACDAGDRVHALLSRMRWQHSRHGWIEQDEIWQAAGRAGLVADVELWQVGQACEQLHTAGGWNLPRLPHVMRISGWQLRDRDFISHVLELLDRYHRQGDHSARQELVERMVPLVRHIARRYAELEPDVESKAAVDERVFALQREIDDMRTKIEQMQSEVNQFMEYVKRELARREGLLLGISSGANVAIVIAAVLWPLRRRAVDRREPVFHYISPRTGGQ